MVRSHSSLIEQSDCEADHWALCSDKVKNEWRHTSTVPHSTSWRAQEQLYFYLSLSSLLRSPLFFVLLSCLLHLPIIFFFSFPPLIFLSHFPSYFTVHSPWPLPLRLSIVRIRTLPHAASELTLTWWIAWTRANLNERDVLKHIGVNWWTILNEYVKTWT